MNDKKHIDRLFQEKLKDFEATPSNAVWENINAELHADEKERRVVPLWLKLSAIAAVLLLLFTVGNSVFNLSTENPNQDEVVDTNNTDSNTDTNQINQEEQSKDVINDIKETLDDDNGLVNTELDEKSKAKSNQADNYNEKSLTVLKERVSNAVVNNVDSKTDGNKQKLNAASDLVNSNKNKANDALAQVAKENQKSSDAVKTTVDKNALKTTIDGLTKSGDAENAVAINSSDNKNNKDNKQTIPAKEKEGEVANKEEEKVNIEEAVAGLTQQDEVGDDIKKRDKTKIEDRWKVSPSIAPVYFNTLGSGSSIHEQFNENSKTGNVNMSYGIRGSYALNDKLSVRAGINKMTLGYSTNDIFVLKNVSASATPIDSRFALRNVDLKEEMVDVSFISADGTALAQIPSVLSDQIVGSIDQKLGFIEVPLELEYELSDEKLGLRVLGGVSALFLNENQVYSTLDGETSLIGKATNINKTSFSANLGVGLDFKLSEKFKLNLEPTFKYQLNTFSNTSGDFKPYFIGIYSGFSFKF